MRILVIGINYAPERSGIAPFTAGLCEHLVGQGHEVEVVTTFPYYPEWRVWEGYRGLLYRSESINGVNVRRVWHFVPWRPSSLLQRLAYHLSFAVTAFLAGLLARKCDVIYCACPPTEAALSAYALAKLQRVPYVIKLADLASDAALATGIMKEGWLVRQARLFEKFIYVNTEAVICLCQGFIEKLQGRGLPAGKIHLIPDWGEIPNNGQVPNLDGFRSTNGISEENFLVVHSGNMGKKQGLMNVVRAAEISKKDRNLVWLLVGEGEEREALAREISRRGLENVRLLPFQPRETLSRMYATADALLLNQKATVQEAVIPSKLLTYMAAERAVVAAVSKESEAARHVSAAQCGLVVPPEDPEALVAAIKRLRMEPALRKSFGANGGLYAREHFARHKILHLYDQFFARFVDGDVQTVASSTSKGAVIEQSSQGFR